ncbi:hypothetical protein [Nonomuraea cavernae]|uniref:Uncharacterized protein n=1 Tax=Nonomuraea cavernae TaxID=2045107 RepID=A0A918DU76_9ACTN|nr:hypothetical protein [Nonomuraea cavernae]GGO83456.1 hypothetical protein GCM10012289_76950 [Nonomuraea cavernae]
MFDMAAHVKALVDQAPPPTPEQIARLRLILMGSEIKGEGVDVAA